MTIELEDFDPGDTNYIGKLNSNNSVLEAAVGTLQSQTSSAASNVATLPNAFAALFGTSTARIGSGSLDAEIDGQTVDLTAGYAFLASAQVVAASGGGTVDLTGEPNDTYYIKVDSSGTLSYSDSATDALWSVVKTGTVLSALTAVAAITWANSDWQAAKVSTALGSFDSLDERLEAMEGGGAQPYDLPMFYPGVPANSALMARIIVPRAVDLPINLTGSYATAVVAATGTTTLTLKKNGSSIGTLVWSAAGTTATITFSAGVAFAAGDVLTLHNQASADATLADISITLVGTR